MLRSPKMLSAGFRDAFEAPGQAGFGVWAYGSDHDLRTVLTPGYFDLVHQILKVGDLMFWGRTLGWSHGPFESRSHVQRALLMITQAEPPVKARLVMDFGGLDQATPEFVKHETLMTDPPLVGDELVRAEDDEAEPDGPWHARRRVHGPNLEGLT